MQIQSQKRSLFKLNFMKLLFILNIQVYFIQSIKKKKKRINSHMINMNIQYHKLYSQKKNVFRKIILFHTDILATHKVFLKCHSRHSFHRNGSLNKKKTPVSQNVTIDIKLHFNVTLDIN